MWAFSWSLRSFFSSASRGAHHLERTCAETSCGSVVVWLRACASNGQLLGAVVFQALPTADKQERKNKAGLQSFTPLDLKIAGAFAQLLTQDVYIYIIYLHILA